MKALLKNYTQSPRKVRLVADLIRGKSVMSARAALTYLPKKSSPAMLKLLNSAVSNAINKGAATEDLFVKTIAVNKGAVLRRFAPRARGRAARFARTMSIVTIELGTRGGEVAAKAPKAKSTAVKKVAAKKTVKKVAKKTADKAE